MSASQLASSSASAGGILTNEECFMLLDIDIFNDDADDLFKNFPSAAKSDLCFHDDVSASLYPPSPPESKPSPAELANDLLQQLETQCKQENIFPNWLEEKVDLPIFDSIPQAAAREEPAVLHASPVPALPPAGPAHTEELLREFETVYGVVELTHLTPPQSPPGPATQLLVSYAQHAQHADHWPLATNIAHAPAPPPAPAPFQRAADEYSSWPHDVDELVRQGAAHLPSPHSSLASSPASSPRSNTTTDEEWSSGGGGSGGGGSRRAKPYSRHCDERRSRKKEQNKNAATRYRQKKKAEVEVLLGEEATLRQRHVDLGDKCSDVQREIRYLKGLMRDLFKAKGLIK